jgi:hypothetical protein
MSGHIVLLGDSILDNASYVPGGPSVVEHVRRFLPTGWKATLVAVDGATVSAVFRQIARIPGDATHLVLSAGGNDALWTAGDIFTQDSSSVLESLRIIGAAGNEFAHGYQRLIKELCSFGLPLSVCTIYDMVPGLDAAEVTGLCMFNDVISRTAFSARATLIDLRLICNENSDYSTISPIEPSAGGGRKIARAILDSVVENQGGRRVII